MYGDSKKLKYSGKMFCMMVTANLKSVQFNYLLAKIEY
jgi:hypothetical protein